MEAVCRLMKKQKTISKRQFLLMQKCFEDARQDEKHVPDLLESIMRPTDPVKEDLRSTSSKWINSDAKSQIGVSTFWIPEICRIPAGGQHHRQD